MAIPGDLLKGVRMNFLRSNVFVPVGRDGERVILAMEDPDDLLVRDAIQKTLPRQGLRILRGPQGGHLRHDPALLTTCSAPRC